MEYHVWCDESVFKGEHFSNFYGGALARAVHVPEVVSTLKDVKSLLKLHGEVKWTKVTENYLDKYKSLISCFFNFLRDDKVKIRIFFRQNGFRPQGLTREQVNNEFFMLYYQFVKHSFGFTQAPVFPEKVYIKMHFDKLPDKVEKNRMFKEYIYGLNTHVNYKNLFLRREDISEVVSHDHEILQCVDVILGAVAFKLNKMDRVKDESTGRRGKKTVAKDKLYSHINKEIRSLYPGYAFNIGVNTGSLEGGRSRWTMPYRHWKFVPASSVYAPDDK